MFKQLYSALTSETSIDQAYADLTQMLEHGAWMFARANEVLYSTVPAEDVRQPLYQRDVAVNELERSIRRKVLRHLTVNPGHDVAVCLALMSVAKDAERIGDYCKNVFEVGAFYSEGFHVDRYQKPLDEVSERLSGLFKALVAATRDSDEVQAHRIITTARGIGGTCDDLIEALLREEETVEFHEAVAYSLLARHYKRVSSHLANIATAVTGRLEDLDFPNEADDSALD